MQRRTFLQGLGAALALRSLPSSALQLDRGAARVRRIGLQLYTLRDAARANLEQTLTDIANIGYRDVELLDEMRNFGMPPVKLRALLDRLHLRAPSTHISTDALNDLPRLMDDAHVLGHQYVIVASLPLGKTPTLDDYRRWADRLNEAGEKVRKSGLWLGFHDEAENFQPIDGQVPYDVMVQRLDPHRVRLQLDLGNAAVGGRDPLPYMRKYRDRYWLFHVKDARSIPAPHDDDLGTGVVKIGEILALAEPLANKHVYIEQETYPGNPIDSARRDYAYLEKLRF